MMGKYFNIIDVTDSKSPARELMISATNTLNNEIAKAVQSGIGSIWSSDEVSETKRKQIIEAVRETTKRISQLCNRAGRDLVSQMEEE